MADITSNEYVDTFRSSALLRGLKQISAQRTRVGDFSTPISHGGQVYIYCNALPISKDSYLFKVTRSDIQILETLQRQAGVNRRGFK